MTVADGEGLLVRSPHHGPTQCHRKGEQLRLEVKAHQY